MIHANPIFREYDIRGLVGDEINETVVRAIGAAFGSIILSEGGKKVVTGYDGRLTSASFAAALNSGLLKSGINVTDVGCVPSPAIYFADISLLADAAIVVTGSHNPAIYNGLKLVQRHRPFFGDSMATLIDAMAVSDDAPSPGTLKAIDIRASYINAMMAATCVATTRRVAWDPGNGASGDVIKAMVERIPGEHFVINADIDGHFPNHHPDPTIAENLVQLKGIMREKNCEIGFAFDGDGDRVVVIDENGDDVYGDHLLALLARDYLAVSPGAAVISDIKASRVFIDEVIRLGGQPVLCKTGHSMIKHIMKEQSIKLAGEVSGHFFFGDKWYGFDDAHYTALRVLMMLDAADATLGELANTLPQTNITPEIRIVCDEAIKFDVVKYLIRRAKAKIGLDVDLTDGVRATSVNGWWLVRASNTQAVIVARAEADSEEQLKELCVELVSMLRDAGINTCDLAKAFNPIGYQP